jgi:alpha-tubulin suppressor-like RCC1 family protein
MSKKSTVIGIVAAFFATAMFAFGVSNNFKPKDAPLSATTVSAGAFHTCALTSAGGVKCWGSNNSGELGNGGTAASNVAIEVDGLGSGVKSVSAGFEHTCAVTGAGSARCWGANDAGQLGNGSTQNSKSPVQVSGLGSGVNAVSAGVWHTCAITDNGAVKCWGANNAGQLGNGSTNNSNVPVRVAGMDSGAIAIAAGASHTCALTSSHGVKCWGRNDSGQLGNGTTSSAGTVPSDVYGLSSGVKAISASGEHTCALTNSGSVKCWGWNPNGQMGDPVEPKPVEVAEFGSGASAIAAGWFTNFALTASGKVQCWGDNHFGELGKAFSGQTDVPAPVSGLDSSVKTISAGAGHACAVMASRDVKCWGFNDKGQLGNGVNANSAVPVEVVGN